MEKPILIQEEIPNKPYRAKRLSNGEWMYGYLLKKQFGFALDTCEKFDKYGFSSLDVAYISENTLGKQAPFPDMLKRPIYEGDILAGLYNGYKEGDNIEESIDDESVFAVKWDVNGWNIGEESEQDYIIVGNVYDTTRIVRF